MKDNPQQTETAEKRLAQGFSVSASVLMEIEWVLRSTYRWPRAAIAAALHDLIDLPTLDSAPAGIGWAIARFSEGADLADMIHVISIESSSTLVTFDRRLARKAGPDTPVPIETLR